MHCAARWFRATLVLVLCFAPAIPCSAESTASFSPGSNYASVMRTINPRLRRHESLAYAAALLTNARQLHVDPMLVMAVVTVESHWNSNALSYHGAEGLGQLKPGTARELGVDPWSGRSNLRGITLYLHQLLAFFRFSPEPIRDAIAGYNAGPHAIGAAGQIPQNGQTPHYVEKVMHAWQTLRSRLGDEPTPLEIANGLGTPDSVARGEAAYWGAGAR